MTAGSGGARPPRFPLALDQVGRGGVAAKPREPLRPQRHLHEAAKDARARPAPQGLGLDSALVRQRMVQRLRAEGIRCEPVFAAMGQVPRHHFVDTALAIQAYEDTSLPIGHGQTISKPSVVARMLALLFDGGSRPRQRSPGPCARDRHRLRLPDGAAGADWRAGGVDRAAAAAARQGPPTWLHGPRPCAPGARRRHAGPPAQCARTTA
jgi:hypothetical protein